MMGVLISSICLKKSTKRRTTTIERKERRQGVKTGACARRLINSRIPNSAASISVTVNKTLSSIIVEVNMLGGDRNQPSRIQVTDTEHVNGCESC